MIIKKSNNEKIKVSERLNELSIKIKKHNFLYHNKDKPIISDKEFDNLVKENNLLEKKFPKLVLKNSPNKKIGKVLTSRFKKNNHKSPMLSL